MRKEEYFDNAQTTQNAPESRYKYKTYTDAAGEPYSVSENFLKLLEVMGIERRQEKEAKLNALPFYSWIYAYPEITEKVTYDDGFPLLKTSDIFDVPELELF